MQLLLSIIISLLIKTPDLIQPIFLLESIGVTAYTLPIFLQHSDRKYDFRSESIPLFPSIIIVRINCNRCVNTEKMLLRFFLVAPLTEKRCNWLDVSTTQIDAFGTKKCLFCGLHIIYTHTHDLSFRAKTVPRNTLSQVWTRSKP